MKFKSSSIASLTLLASAMLMAQQASAAASEEAQQVAASYERFDEADEQFAFLGENCMECHNSEDWAGQLAFDLIAPDEIADPPEIWEKVIKKLDGRMMPPAGQPRPANADADRFTDWVASYLDHAAALDTHAGRVGLHRLNRKEYANAVRDLFGVEVDGATLLPADASVEGFDNVAEALRVSPSFVDQSLTAARVVVAQAVGNPAPRAGGSTYFANRNQNMHIAGMPLGTRGGIQVEHYFPSDGTYKLNIGNLAAALWVTNQEFTHTVIATLDGERFFEMDVGGGDNLKAIDQIGDPAVDEMNAKLKNIEFSATAGPHKLAVTFIHRSFAEFEGTLSPQVPGGTSAVIGLNQIEVQGPFDPSGLSATPARDRIFTCYPSAASEEQACANAIIGRTLRLAYRGTQTAEDLERLMAIYAESSAAEGFEMGVRHALTAIIASPKFFYREENLPQDAVAGEVYVLSDLELASRLSFFVWSSIPDSELLDLAEAGTLHEDAVLAGQVERMLRDPRATTLASNFASQWLNLAKLDEIDPDPALFRDVDPRVRTMFRKEIELLAGDVFLNNKPVTELMTADYSYLNESLALHYGINTVKGDEYRKVELPDAQRHGLLGKGAILMASSYPDRTSPVLRGAYVLDYILGTPPPLPPPNVEALIENKPGERPMTIKERLEVHRTNPSCGGCHGFIDPMGFALEGFDAVGREREKDRFVGQPVDIAATLPDGSPIAGVNELRDAIMERPELFVENMTEKLMLYALGREVEPQDMPTVRSIVEESSDDSYAFFDIVQGIVKSEQFRFVQASVEAVETASARDDNRLETNQELAGQ
jgi:mono/diheme cytochrome c family protein